MMNSLKPAEKRLLHILLPVIVLLAVALPRLFELDRYVTPDETKWLMRSGNFYMALAQDDLAATFQKEHPGVTITWAGMAGFLRRYPSYIAVRPGQIERVEKLLIFLRNQKVSSLDLLVAGRKFVVLAIICSLLLAYWTACRLLGALPAFLGILLIALDPYFVGLSRFLHLDGLMSSLVLLSLLGYLCYLHRGRQVRYLVLSALAAGLAWLTKSPAFFLIPFIGLLTLFDLWNALGKKGFAQDAERGNYRRLSQIWKRIAPALAWLGIASLVFIIVWPAMWVDPLGTLGKVFSQATAYAVEGHENVTFFNGRVYGVGESAPYFYPISFAWRTTPVVLSGLVLALICVIFPQRLRLRTERRQVMVELGLFAILFTVFISLGEKKFDRYLLPVHLILDLVAALGWFTVFEWLLHRFASRWSAHARQWGLFGLVSALAAVQLIGVLQTFPYYLNYYNPLLGGSKKAPQVMMLGWGEGLDLAADYLNSLPAAEDLEVVAWYGNGPFSYLFNGKTISMDVNDSLEDLLKADYVVMYANQRQRQLPSPEVLAYFDQLTPAYIARIGDLEYAWVYKTP